MRAISRRSFVGQAAVAGLAVMAAPTGVATAERVYTTSEWRRSTFEGLLKQKAEAKQLFDITAIDDGNAFEHMVNSLDGLEFGFGIPAGEIKLVAALRSMASVLNFDDSLWEKYKIGERVKVNDPKTSKPALRNIFYASAAGDPAVYASKDPNDEKSLYADSSIQALQARGVQLLACHMAMFAFATGLVESFKLKEKPAEVVEELQGHLLPGVLVVPSMVSAIAMLQNKGRFSYLRM